MATALIGARPIKQVVTGIRPGEKIHESLVSEDEAVRTVERGQWYAIQPMLTEVGRNIERNNCLTKEYSSGDNVMTPEETATLLRSNDLMLPGGEFEKSPSTADAMQMQPELLR
jgi:UDP-glucose 4-epimerase